MESKTLDIHDIYRFFSAMLNEDCEALEQTIHAGLPVDSLHPLRHTTALMEATRLGRIKSAKWLLDHGAAPGFLSGTRISSPLHTAIRHGNIALVEIMLNQIDHVNIVDHNGSTPLHLLAQHVRPATQAAWVSIAQIILLKSQLLDVLDNEGITALHYALIHEWYDFAELLLARGANPNALALGTHISPLHMAALNQQRKLVRLLLAYGANPNIIAADGQTALDIMPEISTIKLVKSQGKPIDIAPASPCTFKNPAH